PTAPVTFHAHLWDHPDLPRWLRFIQRGPTQPGFLYGCPLDSELGTHNLQVRSPPGGFGVTPERGRPTPGGDAPFQAEFVVGDRNVEELLPEGSREMFLRGSVGIWDRGDLHVINVTSALDRGGRVPLPIEGRKEGVHVLVGSHSPFSPCLLSAVSPQSRSRCQRGQRPLASCYDTLAPHFSIRWCDLTLDNQGSPHPVLGQPGFPSLTFVTPGQTGAPFSSPCDHRDKKGSHALSWDNLLIMIIGFFSFFLLFCREKRDLQTSDLQLFHHSSIAGDTRELRAMAGSRDVPRPLSTLPMFNVRTGQRHDPMGSARAPLL
ncbi:SGCA protein, partial [Sterrhoptilus dennistouni]|nr:SGCA protein [Sterrhoptilus dennistouni]